jgi:hypothetical protein
MTKTKRPGYEVRERKVVIRLTDKEYTILKEIADTHKSHVSQVVRLSLDCFFHVFAELEKKRKNFIDKTV